MGARAPPSSFIINTTNPALQWAARKYGMNRTPMKKPYFGRHELAQLLEQDMFSTPCMPLAENHHLAWTLGMICGVRPGSLAESPKRKGQGQYLAWKDVEITRGLKPGMFNVRVTFRFLKGNRDNQKILEPMVFDINSPTISEHVPFSPAHRMLVMLLRRKYLASHDSLDSLLRGNERIIQIKAIALDLPVLLAGKPRGIGVSDNPMASKSLTVYQCNSAVDGGYGWGKTFYAWRRKAGTEVHRQYGTEKTKEFMAHSVTSETFQKSYNQGLFDLPVFEIAMRADTNTAAAKMDEDSLAVLVRVADLTRVKGVFLQRTIMTLENCDQALIHAQNDGDLKAIRNIKRRLRRTAFVQLYDKELKRVRDSMTVSEFEERKKALNSGPKLMDKIFDAHHATTSNPPTHNARQSTGSHNDSGSKNPLEDDTILIDEIDEQDLETVGGPIRVDVDHDDILTTETTNFKESTTEFFEYVQVFMSCLGQERFVIQETEDLHCQLCIDDAAMNEDAKTKIWSNLTKLRLHQQSNVHTPYQTWLRRLQMAYNQSDKVRWVCPYSESCPDYGTQERLIKHIKASTAENTSPEHDDAKRLDGWYEADWQHDPGSSDPASQKRSRKAIGLTYSNEKEGEPSEITITSQHTIIEAPGPVPYPILPEHRGIVFGGDETDLDALWRAPIPELYRSIVFSGESTK